MIAWLALAILLLGVLWLALLYHEEVRVEADPDPLPRIRVRRAVYDWEARGDFA
jgi:hypothetical protein